MASKIDEQIKELQLKKKKTEFLSHILASAVGYDHKDFKEVKKSVVSDLEEYITSKIAEIESGESVEPTDVNDPSRFSDAQTEILQKIATRALLKEPGPPKPQKPIKEATNEPVTAPDKLAFALGNRHLAGKKVSIANDSNMIIKGEVVGLDAPNVIVKTETGPTIQVPIENISLI